MAIRLVLTSALIVSLSSFAYSQEAANDYLSYYEYGNTLFSQGNYAQAIDYYQHASDLSPEFWQASQGLGSSYYMTGDYKSALMHVTKALMLNPGDINLITFKAQLEALLGAARSEEPEPGSPGAAQGMGAGVTPLSGRQKADPYQERSLDKLDFSRGFYCSLNAGLCKIWEGAYERIAAEYNPYAVSGVSIVSFDYIPGTTALNVHFGGGKRVSHLFFLGLGFVYNKVHLLDYKLEFYDPSIKTGLLTQEIKSNGSLMIVGPEVMMKFPADSFVFLLKAGIGYAKGSISEERTDSYHVSGVVPLPSWSVSSSGWALSCGCEMAVPIGSAMFVSAEVAVVTAMMGSWGGTANWETGDVDGVLMEGDTKGFYEEGNWTLEQAEELGYYMMVMGDETASEAAAMGWEKAKMNLGGYGARVGLGFQF